MQSATGSLQPPASSAGTQQLESLRGVFSALERLQFGAANEALKARAQPATQAGAAQGLLPTLLMLSMCEALYHGLTWLEAKWLRKDHLASLLQQLAADLRKQLQQTQAQADVAGLVRGVLALVQARQELALAYALLANATSSAGPAAAQAYASHLLLAGLPPAPGSSSASGAFHLPYADESARVERAAARAAAAMTHPLAAQLRGNLKAEAALLAGVLQLQEHLARHRFLDAVLLAHRTRLAIDDWRRALAREDEMLLPMQEFRVVAARNELDLLASVEAFVAKVEAVSVSVVLDTAAAGSAGGAFRLRVRDDAEGGAEGAEELPQGLAAWPAVAHFPLGSEPPVREHWPNVVSLLQEQAAFFARQPRDAVLQRDTRLGYAYVLAQLEPALYLVVVLPADKKRHEPAARAFAEALCRQLRNETLFARLAKPA